MSRARDNLPIRPSARRSARPHALLPAIGSHGQERVPTPRCTQIARARGRRPRTPPSPAHAHRCPSGSPADPWPAIDALPRRATSTCTPPAPTKRASWPLPRPRLCVKRSRPRVHNNCCTPHAAPCRASCRLAGAPYRGSPAEGSAPDRTHRPCPARSTTSASDDEFLPESHDTRC